VRQTDDKVVGEVGPIYTIVQNEEAFEWMDFLMGGNGHGEGFDIKTAGSLRGGSVVWVLAKTPFTLDLPGSPVDQYVLVSNRHDGSQGIQAAITPIRVVCMNTLSAALSGAKSRVAIRHTPGVRKGMAEAQEVLGVARASTERLEKTVAAMQKAKLGKDAFSDFLDKLVPAGESQASLTRAQNTRGIIATIYQADALGQAEINGTAWGAYNAVQAYADHGVTQRQTKDGDPRIAKFDKLLWGVPTLADKAFALLQPAGK
jgi:phage/plasmid-like protein (TIGR03299 family)